MPVKVNSQRFGWAGNYATLHSAAMHIHGQLTARGAQFAAGTGDWTHLRALIVELRVGRQAIADAFALENTAQAASFIEGTAVYADAAAGTAEYAALDAAVLTLIGQLAITYNTQPERTYDANGTPTTTQLTAGQNNGANNAVNTVLALFDSG